MFSSYGTPCLINVSYTLPLTELLTHYHKYSGVLSQYPIDSLTLYTQIKAFNLNLCGQFSKVFKMAAVKYGGPFYKCIWYILGSSTLAYLSGSSDLISFFMC